MSGVRFITDEERRMEPPEPEPITECDMCHDHIYDGEEAWYWEDMTLCPECMEEAVDEARDRPWREFARDYLLASEIKGG